MPRITPPPAWAVTTSLATIVGALLAMLLIPVWYERRAGPQRDAIAEVAEPTRAEITRIHFALAHGESLLRDALEARGSAGDGILVSEYRAQVAGVDSAVTRLGELARSAGREGKGAAAAWTDSVRQSTARWERSGAALLARPRAAVARARDAEHINHYTTALVAAARLDGAVADDARRLRAGLVAMEATARRWTAALAALAFGGVLAALWLALAARRAAHVAAARGRALEEAAESRARFTRGLSHDLKNPLGAIDGHAALLELELHGPTTDAQRQALARIRGSVRALLALVDDVLALARAEAGELRVTPCATDVRALVREVADEHRAAAAAAGLAFDVRVDDAVPELATDPARVRQVLGNMLSNAVKYTPRGGSVDVAVREERDGEGRCVRVRVADTGPGIPADQREQVFAEFVRLPGTTAPGAGLGLAISRRIARLLGGELWVDPARAVGACFVLDLPAPAAGHRPAPAGGPQGQAG